MTRQTEAKRLARCRTLEMIAASKVASIPDNHPQRAALQRKLHAIRDKLRVAERDHEASQ